MACMTAPVLVKNAVVMQPQVRSRPLKKIVRPHQSNCLYDSHAPHNFETVKSLVHTYTARLPFTTNLEMIKLLFVYINICVYVESLVLFY